MPAFIRCLLCGRKSKRALTVLLVCELFAQRQPADPCSIGLAERVLIPQNGDSMLQSSLR